MHIQGVWSSSKDRRPTSGAWVVHRCLAASQVAGESVFSFEGLGLSPCCRLENCSASFYPKVSQPVPSCSRYPALSAKDRIALNATTCYHKQ